LKTIVIVAIAVLCSVGVVAVVFIVSGMYQQALFDEYMDDAQGSQIARPLTTPNLPAFDPFP
jgi:ABC-type uncharacterized transport system permease subunit